MKIACILPAHNEEAVLERSVCAVSAWAAGRWPKGDFRLIISENGSDDCTREIADGLARGSGAIAVVSSPVSGKGAAIKRGMAAVEADAYLAMDVDLSTDLASAGGLLDAIAAGADLAIASRRMPASQVERPMLRQLITAAYAQTASAALRLGIRDTQCGCKAFSRRIRDDLVPLVADDGYFFDTELLARARRGGFSIAEIGARWREPAEFRRKSKVRLLSTSIDFARKLMALRRELGT